MNKNEVQMLGFEIVAYAGEARSLLMQSLDCYLKKEYLEAKKYFEEAETIINDAHQTQMEMLAREAQGIDLPYSLTMVHGQDHLMSAVLLRDVIQLLINNVKF